MTLPFPINYTYHPSGGEFGGGLYYANTQEAITKQYADMTNQFASRCKNNRGVWNNGVCGPNQVGGVSGMGGGMKNTTSKPLRHPHCGGPHQMPCIYPLIMPYDPGTTATLATGPVGPTLPYNPYMAPNPGYNPYQGLPGSIPMSGLNGFKDADWDEDKQLMLNAILVGSVMGGIFYRSKPSTGMLIGALSFYLLKTTGWVR